MNDGKKSRRRRSSSLIYQEPPESIEHMSDQSALPNVNADWVNAKGTHVYGQSPVRCEELWEATSKSMADFSFSYFGLSLVNYPMILMSPSRSLGYPRHMHHRPQTPLRRHPRRLSRNIMDSRQHRLHVQLLPHVPLGPRRPL